MGIEYQGEKSLKSGKENNRVILIKRAFRPIDKITANSKKSFIEGLMPFEGISSLEDTKVIVVRAGKEKVLYRDGDTITKLEISGVEEVFETKVNSSSYIIILSAGKLIQYTPSL